MIQVEQVNLCSSYFIRLLSQLQTQQEFEDRKQPYTMQTVLHLCSPCMHLYVHTFTQHSIGKTASHIWPNV